jgi:hypothetical protein
VHEEVKSYLESLSNPEKSKDFLSFVTLIEHLKKEGIDIIWEKIKPRVADRMFDEFKSIYQGNRENPDFINLVDAGQYTELTDLNDYQQSISSSPGYRKYCSQTLHSVRFFSLKKGNVESYTHLNDSALATKIELRENKHASQY